MAFNINEGQISRLASSSDVFKRGVKYYREGRIKQINFREINNVNVVYNIASVKVIGNYDSYTVNIIFDSRGDLKSYDCECKAFDSWDGGCKHIVAVLLKLCSMNKETTNQLKSNKPVINLLNIFEQKAMEEIDISMREHQPGSLVSLEPCICIESADRIYLTFSIGIKRKYILKNILDFVNNLKHAKKASYGKEFTLVHKKSMFDAGSAKLVDFILEEYNNIYTVSKTSANFSMYSATTLLNGRKLPVSRRGIDDLFQMFNGKTIAANISSSVISNSNSNSMSFTDSLPPLRFNIKKSENGVEISPTDRYQNFIQIEGESGRYIIFPDTFYCVSPGYYDTVLPVINAINHMAGRKIIFTKGEYGRLEMFLLPKLREYNLIDCKFDLSDDVNNYKLVKKAYLDIENSDVTCKLMFCYGNNEINALHSEKVQFARNFHEEYKCRNILSRMGFTASEKSDKYNLTGDNRIYDFYKSSFGVEYLRETCEIYATDEFMNKSVKQSSGASFGLRLNGGILEVEVDIDGYSREELLEVLESYQLKKNFHRLKDGSFINLDESDFDAVAELVSGLGLSDKDILNGKTQIPKYRALYAEQVINKNAELKANCNKSFRNLVNDFNSYKYLEFKIPPDLEKTLRGYQKNGFNWLKVIEYYGFGGILADDMGLGKTLQVITVILSAKIENDQPKGGKPSIVIAPTSLIYNWEKEFKRFAPEINVSTIAGVAAKRKETILSEETPDVYITTYDMLKRDIDHYNEMQFRYVIVDEAQNIKNPLTQNAKTVKGLKGETRFALTGTPIENSLSELWSIFDFIMPGYLFNSTKFSKHYESPIIKNGDNQRAEELRKQISPFILRRVKKDVLKELPEKIETTLYAEMLPEQRKIYSSYLLKAKGELEDVIKTGRYKESQIEILSMLTRLRQICCHPAMFIDDYTGGSGKMDLTVEAVQNYIGSGHRILIFSQFTKMLSILRGMLDESNQRYFYLDGSTPSKERIEMADRFNQGEGSVFLISLKAGGTGLNLTGADMVIHYDPWWNPAVMQQASDRAHRFGQKQTVQVINIVSKDTIEEKIMALQSLKKGLVDTIIQEGANFINKMSEEDILELFKE